MRWLLTFLAASATDLSLSAAAFVPSAARSERLLSSASNKHASSQVRRIRIVKRIMKPIDEAANSKISEDASLALDRRTLLNCLLVSAAAGGTAATQPANAFLFGPSSASSEGPRTTEALDRSGQPIIASQFLATKSGTERTMVQGLKSDPTYLIVTVEGGGLEPYALSAECTHLGCLVPWDPIQKKFECPCHGSQYDARGSVIRGPAPGPLKLAKVSTEADTGKILLENWADEDFRTGEKPWWV
mmetsp:Transcript_6918/g.16479  ORF Transcript_6918/g.16479 Transcript_6918/m.16479 type:complete len:245 (+) Transcript_6918:18-752(+)